MALPPLILVRTETASEAAAGAKLSEEARALLTPGQTLTDYLERLHQEKRFMDVCSLLAITLPLREAAWWACLCIQQTHGTEVTGKHTAALRAVLAWILEPTAALRHAALVAGEDVGTDRACGCLAQAVGQAPAALGPPEASMQAAARLLRRALLLASVHGDPRVLAPYPEHFVKLGLGVAAGDYTWKKLVAVRRA